MNNNKIKPNAYRVIFKKYEQAYQTDLSLHLPSYEEIPYDF